MIKVLSLVMSPDDELAFAVAWLLKPDMFSHMDTQWGHVPKERERHLRRAARLIEFLRKHDHARNPDMKTHGH